MIASAVASALSLFGFMANKNGLSPSYRCLQITPTQVCGCSVFGIMERSIMLGITDTIYVDASAFLSVVASLPGEEELTLAHENGVLSWTCGTTKGKLAAMAAVTMPKITHRIKPDDAWKPTDNFVDVLELGGIACGSEALRTIDMWGVCIDNTGDETVVYASDNSTISVCSLGAKLDKAPDIVTLRPDAVALLVKAIDPTEGALYFDKEQLLYKEPSLRISIKYVPPLKQDIMGVVEGFSANDIAVPLPRDRVLSFLKRVLALAENRRNMYVEFSATEGRVVLSFAEGLAAADEYYLVDGLQMPDLPAVKLDAARISRALGHADKIVLNHVEEGVITFQGMGDAPFFTYIISGRA